MKIPTISAVHPSTNKAKPTIMVPPIMNGLRRPHFDLELSASTPMTGCIMSPDNGPAIHTRDVWALLRPSWRRYGVPSASNMLAPLCRTFGESKCHTCHLYAPGKPAGRFMRKSSLQLVQWKTLTVGQSSWKSITPFATTPTSLWLKVCPSMMPLEAFPPRNSPPHRLPFN